VFVSLSAILVSACQPTLPVPATLYTPEVVGLVATVTPGAGRITTFALAHGAMVTIDGARATVIKGSGNASVGDLLLTDNTSSWISSLRLSSITDAPAGCFDLPNAGVDDGDYIKFTSGLRLRKAVNFDPGIARENTNGLFDYPQITFCVDSTGAVTTYGW